MTTNPRETQFASFAELLFTELKNNSLLTLADHPNLERAMALQEKIDEQVKQIIARRAGEFAAHVAAFLPEREMRMMRIGMLSPRQVVDHVPDMIEPLPEEAK